MKKGFSKPASGDKQPRINRDIRVSEVRVISAEGEPLGVLSIQDALAMAEDQNLDLVEVAPESTPPVCKILDYGKLRYQLQKRQATARKNQKIVELKEVVVRPNIEEHDFQTKMRSIRRFLEEGNKVKITLRFRGRELSHIDIGKRVVDRIREIVIQEEIGKVDFEPRLEGRHMIMILSPAMKK